MCWDIPPSLSNLLSVAFVVPPTNKDFGSMNVELYVKSISKIELIPLNAVGLMILVASFLPRCFIHRGFQYVNCRFFTLKK